MHWTDTARLAFRLLLAYSPFTPFPVEGKAAIRQLIDRSPFGIVMTGKILPDELPNSGFAFDWKWGQGPK